MTDQEFYASLSDDNEVAFTQVVKLFEEKLQDLLSNLNDRDDPRYFQQDFMNKVVAAAHALDVDEISIYKVPPITPSMSAAFAEFKLTLERYVMRVSLKKFRTGKVYSVELSAGDKERIHFLISKIRLIIESAELDQDKKNSLYSKLNAFDADVDRTRTPFNNAMLMALGVANVVKKYGEALNPLNDLVKGINDLLAAAKGKEPEQLQLPPPSEHKQLPPPPRQIEGPKNSERLDSDLPF